MLNYIQDNALIALVCSLKALQSVTLSSLLFFKQLYFLLFCHIQIINFLDFKFHLHIYAFTHSRISTFPHSHIYIAFTHLHIPAFKYWLHMVADLSSSNRLFKIYTLTHLLYLFLISYIFLWRGGGISNSIRKPKMCHLIFPYYWRGTGARLLVSCLVP